MLRLAGGKIGRNLFFVATIVFFGLPVLWLLLAPTKSNYALSYENPMSFGSLAQFGDTWNNLVTYNDGIIWRWALNSIWYTAVTVGVALAASLPAGYAMAKFRFRFRGTLLFLTLLLMLVPQAALILPMYLEMSTFHLINTPWAVILPLTFYPFGVYMTYLYAKASVPSEIIEAARIDGCGEFGIFRRVFLPLARPVIVMITFFGVVGTWNAFFLPFIMLTDDKLATLQTGLQLLVASTSAVSGGNQSTLPIHAPEVALASVISITPIVLMFLFAQKQLIAGQAQGAVKG
ncbi:MAG: carbohydrate ABC transporter permease [Propionibacteriaceae bacterium]|jgi:multiple sugar transport system permease protein|nr:carbohydrate ABC transporter permease [Propionibacteriaceae bacterium]